MLNLVDFLKVANETISTLGVSTFLLIILCVLLWRYYPSYKKHFESILLMKEKIDHLNSVCEDFKNVLSVLTVTIENVSNQMQVLVNRLLDIIEKGVHNR